MNFLSPHNTLIWNCMIETHSEHLSSVLQPGESAALGQSQP